MREPQDLDEGTELARRAARAFVRETELIPVRHLSLDLDEPITGWERALVERGVEVVEDDLGRRCVRREVLGDLLREERERLARIAAQSAARAAAAVVPARAGIPAVDGATPLESLQANDPGYTTVEDEFGRGGRSVFTQLLDQELEQGRRQERDKRAKAANKAKP